MQPLPDPGLLPVPQPPPAGRATATAQLLREQAPWTARSQDEDDATKRGTLRHSGAAALRFRWLLR
jgi:hypothetical protein